MYGDNRVTDVIGYARYRGSLSELQIRVVVPSSEQYNDVYCTMNTEQADSTKTPG